MNVLCPACMKRVAVPDEAAGKLTPCPVCGQSFTPPALTPAVLDSAPTTPAKGPTMEPTPPPAPPTPPARSTPVAPSMPSKVETPKPTSPPSLANGPCCTWTLGMRWVKWLAPVSLIVAFVLSFFPWVGSYPNGTAVYSQSAWGAMRGSKPKVVDAAGDKVMIKEDDLKKHGKISGSLLLYCLLLIPAAGLSAATIAMSIVTFTMPDVFKRIWEHRHTALATLSIILPALLILPVSLGFGLETAAESAAEEKVPPLATPAEGAKLKAIDLQERELRRDVEVSTYCLDRTCWMRLALLAQGVALLGTGMTLWLNRRGDKPEPRMEFYC